MCPTPPTLFYDLGSPYAYLAVERAADVLGLEPRLEPVLVGGIFVLRGRGSWSQTPEREQRIAEIQARANRYGLPPVKWPPGWPNNTLKAMRAATWAGRLGVGQSFARTAFQRAFVRGEDLSQIDVLVDIGSEIGLPGSEIPEAIDDPATKAALREATDRAWASGVIGVPCIGFLGEVFYGDDRLEAAARRLKRDGPG